MRIFIAIAVVAGALLGVTALAGKPVAQSAISPPPGADAGATMFGTSAVEAILPVVDALRSGDAVYAGMSNRVAQGDYVPPRPPL